MEDTFKTIGIVLVCVMGLFAMNMYCKCTRYSLTGKAGYAYELDRATGRVWLLHRNEKTIVAEPRVADVSQITPMTKEEVMSSVPVYYQNLLKDYEGDDWRIFYEGIQYLKKEGYDPDTDVAKATIDDLHRLGKKRLGIQ